MSSSRFVSTWYEQQLKTWFAPAKRGECLSLQGLSRTDQQYRVHQLLTETGTASAKRAGMPSKWYVLDCNLELIEEPLALQNWVATTTPDASEKSQPLIVVLDTDTIALEKPQLVATFEHLHYQKGIQFIFLFEDSVTGSRLAPRLNNIRLFFQNTAVFPLLDEANSMAFLTYLSGFFQTEISKNAMLEIATRCGGQMWLMTDAVRYGATSGDWEASCDHPSFWQKVEVIYGRLNERERQIVDSVAVQGKLPQGMTAANADVLYVLERRVILCNKSWDYRLGIPVLEEMIHQMKKHKFNVSLDQMGRIVHQSVVVDPLFSRHERRLLKLFLARSGHIFSREACAKAVWQENYDSEYTDWALDQVMKRLRQKLVKLGVASTNIETLRGQGYRFWAEGKHEVA